MIWLAGQVWPFLVAATLAGAFGTLVASVGTVRVERWVEPPVREAEPHAGSPEQPDAQPAGNPGASARPAEAAAEPDSPFPALLGQPDVRPWEAEELWSRPARPGA